MGILHGAFYASLTHTLIHLYIIRSYVNMFLHSYTYMLTVTNTNHSDINLDIEINIFALTVNYLIDH